MQHNMHTKKRTNTPTEDTSMDRLALAVLHGLANKRNIPNKIIATALPLSIFLFFEVFRFKIELNYWRSPQYMTTELVYRISFHYKISTKIENCQVYKG